MGLEKNFPNREQPVWAPEEQVPAEPGEGRATDCGGEPMGAGSHRAHGCWKPSQDQRGFIRSDLHFKR